MDGNLDLDGAMSQEGTETRHFQRMREQLQTAKANSDRVLAGEAYAELDVLALLSDSEATRYNAAALIDQAELEWYLDDIERGGPLEEWLIKRMEAYDRAAPGSKRRDTILGNILRIADADETPQTAAREMRLFLAAPEQYRLWRNGEPA